MVDGVGPEGEGREAIRRNPGRHSSTNVRVGRSTMVHPCVDRRRSSPAAAIEFETGRIRVLDPAGQPMEGGLSLDAKSALPDDCKPPTGREQRKFRSPVPLPVADELGLPERSSGLRHHEVPAALMGVPETSVHLDCSPPPCENDVRGPGQLSDVKPESQAVRVQEPSNRQFWRCIRSLHPGHDQAAGCGVDRVCHATRPRPVAPRSSRG